MALIVEDRIMETSTTTGTGALTLAGAYTGYKAFSSVCTSPSDTCYYLIEAVDGSGYATGEWETGLGTYSAASTLTRTTVSRSSNANAAVSFAAGTKRVSISVISASAGSLILLQQQTASASATLNFTTAIQSSYDEYRIELINVIPATNAVNFVMRMSTNGGSSYDSGANYAWTALISNRFAATGVAGADSGATFMQTNANAIDNTATAGLCGSITLFSPGSTSLHKYITGQHTQLNTASIETEFFTGAYQSTTAVNAFQFLFSAGNITSGTIRVYGVRK